MYGTPVSNDEIIKIAHLLKPKNSSEYDEIRCKILKKVITEIAEPITYIINQSLKMGIVPEKMKIAKVVPIYKFKDQNQLNNYRPISLLPVFSKLLEKNMYNITYKYKHNLFYKHQYGFRQKHSTIHPIIQYLNHIVEVNNKTSPEFSMAVFLDLSKAFDTISHNILLQKLSKLGI